MRLGAPAPAEPEITPELVAAHGLTPSEYERVVAALGREPNLTELGIFAVMWSEHCSYKSSKLHLRSLPTRGKRVLQGPGENAGAVEIGGGLVAVFKIESHNHPSFIEPYQGAATGVGGILRDVFTMGARPLASMDSLRFGSPDHPRTPYLVRGVVAGIGGYGNCVGVPTVGGETFFEECYNSNILVNVFTLGIARKEKIFRGKARGPGNLLLYVGSKTGRDGIHGATMASAAFSAGAEQRRPTVQVGDPFTEKLLLEACLEIMRGDSLVAIQDMGAAGLTSASSEMAARGGVGVELELDRVPLRESGMTPYEIMLSESQERMLLVVRKGKEKEALRICEKWDLDAAVVGRVVREPILRATFGGKEVVRIPVAALTEEAPLYDRPRRRPHFQDEIQHLDPEEIPRVEDPGGCLKRLLASPNIASKEWVYRQYDWYVRSNTVVGPGADAAVIRVKGTRKGLALTIDGNGRYCYLDPYLGGIQAVAEAARNLACVGAEPIGISDCLNFGSPESPEVMWQFTEVIRGMREACLGLGVPIVSGNVSFYNETDGTPIYPTPTIAMVGLLGRVEAHATAWFKRKGDLIVLLGENGEGIGGSEYLKLIGGEVKGRPPRVDLRKERAVQAVCRRAIREGLLRSAHDVSEGGLAVALAECCVGSERPLGATVKLGAAARADFLLFGEAQSRIVVSLDRRCLGKLRRIAAREGVPLEVIGKVGGARLTIEPYLSLPVAELRSIWSSGLERALDAGDGATS